LPQQVPKSTLVLGIVFSSSFFISFLLRLPYRPSTSGIAALKSSILLSQDNQGKRISPLF